MYISHLRSMECFRVEQRRADVDLLRGQFGLFGYMWVTGILPRAREVVGLRHELGLHYEQTIMVSPHLRVA